MWIVVLLSYCYCSPFVCKIDAVHEFINSSTTIFLTIAFDRIKFTLTHVVIRLHIDVQPVLPLMGLLSICTNLATLEYDTSSFFQILSAILWWFLWHIRSVTLLVYLCTRNSKTIDRAFIEGMSKITNPGIKSLFWQCLCLHCRRMSKSQNYCL